LRRLPLAFPRRLQVTLLCSLASPFLAEWTIHFYSFELVAQCRVVLGLRSDSSPFRTPHVHGLFLFPFSLFFFNSRFRSWCPPLGTFLAPVLFSSPISEGCLAVCIVLACVSVILVGLFELAKILLELFPVRLGLLCFFSRWIVHWCFISIPPEDYFLKYGCLSFAVHGRSYLSRRKSQVPVRASPFFCEGRISVFSVALALVLPVILWGGPLPPVDVRFDFVWFFVPKLCMFVSPRSFPFPLHWAVSAVPCCPRV